VVLATKMKYIIYLGVFEILVVASNDLLIINNFAENALENVYKNILFLGIKSK